MNNNAKTKKKARLNAIDWFLIVAVLLCAAAGVLRMVIGSEGGTLTTGVKMEDYIVSFKIANVRNSSMRYLKDGDKFYLASNNSEFGTIEGSVSVTPALYRIEDAYGKYIQAFAPENGDATRVDVTGTMRVSGYMSDNGFLLDGLTALSINKSVALRSPFLYVTITVTGITKAN